MKWLIRIISVLFVVFLIVAIYLPGLIASRTADNSRLACVEVKRIVSAELDFAKKHNGTFATFEQLAESGLLDSDFSIIQKRGYDFSLTIHDKSFELNAVPANYRWRWFKHSNAYSFLSDQNGIVYGADKKGERATIEDSAINCEKMSSAV